MTPLDWINIALMVGGFLFTHVVKRPVASTLPPAVPPPVMPQPPAPSSGNPLIDEFLKWLAEKQKPQQPTEPPAPVDPQPPVEPPAARGPVVEMIEELLDVLRRKVGKLP